MNLFITKVRRIFELPEVTHKDRDPIGGHPKAYFLVRVMLCLCRCWYRSRTHDGAILSEGLEETCVHRVRYMLQLLTWLKFAIDCSSVYVRRTSLRFRNQTREPFQMQGRQKLSTPTDDIYPGCVGLDTNTYVKIRRMEEQQFLNFVLPIDTNLLTIKITS